MLKTNLFIIIFHFFWQFIIVVCFFKNYAFALKNNHSYVIFSIFT